MVDVTISGNSYFTYVDATDATIYFAPGVSAAAAAFKALADADAKNSYLVSASRYLDSLAWSASYDTVAEREVVQAILDACCEIAGAMATDPDFGTTITAETKRLKAGSVEIENYRNSVSRTNGTPVSFLPPNIRALLAGYLGSFTRIATSKAFGACRPADSTNFDRNIY